MDPIIGQIILWPVPWVPAGWALCDGSVLPINNNQALFSLIGSIYGGNGSTTFALPDLRSRVPMGTTGANQVAQISGATTSQVNATGVGAVNIATNNLPAHTHAATFTPGGGNSSVAIAIPACAKPSASTDTPDNTTVLSVGSVKAGALPVTTSKQYSSTPADTTLLPFNVSVPAGSGTVAVAATGNGQPLPVQVTVPVTVSTVQPSLTLNYIIALTGVYPSRP